MRIAYLITQYPKVSHTFIRREIKQLEECGHVVVRLAIRDPGAGLVDADDIEERRVTTYCFGGSKRSLAVAVVREVLRQPLLLTREVGRAFTLGVRSEVGYLRNLLCVLNAILFLDILRRNNVEHVHAHFESDSTSAARIIHRLGGPPYSFTGHGRLLFDSPRSRDIRGKVAEAAFAVGVCDYTAAQLMRWSKSSDWGKIHVIRCAVSEAFFDRAAGMSSATDRIVCVGRLSEEKGQLLLLEAFAHLAGDFPDAQLSFVGDGRLRNTIEARSAELGIAGRVSMTGNLDESGVTDEIIKSRALVVPSFMEGLPVVIMEAFALKRPVVATYVSGIPELVVPGENGWLVPAGNTNRLEGALRAVFTSPLSVLEEMGERGQQVVREKHSLSVEVAKLDNLFKKTRHGQYAEISAIHRQTESPR